MTRFGVDDDGNIIGVQLNFYEDLHRRTMNDDEREVTPEEVDWALDKAKAEGGIFNGCVSYYLNQRYGNRVRHIMGFNWVVKETE